MTEHGGWRAVAVGMLVLTAVVPAATGLSAGAAPADETEPQPGVIDVDHVVERQVEPGVVRVRTTYRLPETVTEFIVNDTGDERITITNTSGFVPVSDRYVWAPRLQGPTATVTWRFSTNDTSDVFGTYQTVGTGDWALFDVVTPYYRYRYSEHAPRTRTDVSVAEGTPGYVAGDLVYLGEYETRTARRGDQRYTLVVPATVSSPPNATAVFDTFAFSREQLSVGAPNRHVVSVLSTDPVRDAGVQHDPDFAANGTTTMWVPEEDPGWDTSYYSEYVHTRQGFDSTARMGWLTEAQDEYYSTLLPLYRGHTTYDRFHRTVATDENATAVLAPPDRTAPRREADYDKGGRVLAALDGEIRRATDRNRSFEDVWRRLNAHEGQLDYAEFKDIVATVAGESLDDWLDRYLTTTAAPTVPDNRTLYAPVDEGVDSDGDGVTTQGELENGTNPFAVAEQAEPASEDDEPTTLDKAVVLVTLGGVGVGSMGLVVVLLARGLDRFVDRVPALVSERSLLRLALLVVASIVVLFVYFGWFA